MRWPWVLGVLAACGPAPAPALPSQTTAPTGDPCVAHHVTGVVRFQDGEGVAGATVVLEQRPERSPPVVVTDESGEFTLGPVPPGAQRLTIYVLDLTATKAYRQGPCTSEVEIWLHDPSRPLFR